MKKREPSVMSVEPEVMDSLMRLLDRVSQLLFKDFLPPACTCPACETEGAVAEGVLETLEEQTDQALFTPPRESGEAAEKKWGEEAETLLKIAVESLRELAIRGYPIVSVVTVRKGEELTALTTFSAEDTLLAELLLSGMAAAAIAQAYKIETGEVKKSYDV